MLVYIKRYFWPHKHNNHIPHSLKEGPILIAIIIAVLISFLPSVWKSTFFKTKTFAQILPVVLIDLTNEQRIKYGLDPLTKNDNLNYAAKLKSLDMSKRSYFSHDSPDGKKPWYFIELSGYKYNDAGENLAIYYYNSKDVIDGWMNSPLHRENILDPKYKDIGISLSGGNYEGYDTEYIVQMFGSPADIINTVEKNSTKKLAQKNNDIIYLSSSNENKKQVVKKENLNTAIKKANENTNNSKVLGLQDTKKLEVNNKNSSTTSLLKLATIENTDDANKKYNVYGSNINQKESFDEQKLNETPTKDRQINLKESKAYYKYLIKPEIVTKYVLYVFLAYSITSLSLLFASEIQHHHTKHIFYGVFMIISIATMLKEFI